jgi:hypothetical protein
MNKQNIFESYNTLLESSDVERIKKILVRFELFKKSINIPGDIIECGVFKGTGHLYWLKLLKIFDNNSSKKVIGFDTFTKFPKSTLDYELKSAKAFIKESKFKKNNFQEVKRKIKNSGLSIKSELVKGDIIKTSKSYVNKNKGFRISLLHLDLDTYEGTKATLKNFFPLVSKGGVLIFDEYGSRGWGESDAIDEYFEGTKYKIKKTEYSFKPSAYLIKE